MRRLAEWAAVLLALAAAGGWVYNRLLPPPPLPPSSAELQALRDLRDGMQARLRKRIVAAGGEEGLARAPHAGIIIGMPTSLTRSIVEQMAAGFFRETVLIVRNVHVHKSDEVKAKVVFRQTVGEFDLDADIIEARGLLRPGRPKLRLHLSSQRIEATLTARTSCSAGCLPGIRMATGSPTTTSSFRTGRI